MKKIKQKKTHKRKHIFLFSKKIIFLYSGVVLGIFVLIFLHTIYKKVLGSSTNTVDTVISVDTSTPIKSIPPRFLGLSFETSNLCNLVGAWDTKKFEQLMLNLGATTMRIGGNSADKTTWNPTATASCLASGSIINQQLINSLFSLVARINTKILWTLNLVKYDPTTNAQEADYVIRTGGSNLFATGFGNEPDLYIENGSSIPFDHYLAKWNNYKSAVLALHGSAQLMAADSCCSQTDWLSDTSQYPALTLITRHFYPTSISSTDPDRAATIANLLSNSLMQNTATTIDSWVQAGGTLPLSIDETNSTTGGGTSGVSNTFASTLWGADYLFTALEHRVSYINFHTGGSPSLYSPIDKYGNPQPLYYALLFFHYIAQNGTAIKTNTHSLYNVSAHAIQDNNGTIRVAVINKDLIHTANIEIALPTAYENENELLLSAPSVSATSGITFGGSAIGDDGTWIPSKSELLTICGKSTYITLPPTTAAAVVFTTPTQRMYNCAPPTPTATPQPTSSYNQQYQQGNSGPVQNVVNTVEQFFSGPNEAQTQPTQTQQPAQNAQPTPDVNNVDFQQVSENKPTKPNSFFSYFITPILSLNALITKSAGSFLFHLLGKY